MKKLYSIGETAKIMGISTQTLRSYSNMKLVEPEEINTETGYRYYSFNQLHFIDRIKYLRHLGISLKDIADVLNNGKPERLLYYLEKQKQNVAKQIHDLTELIEELDWYATYFKQLKKIHLKGVPYIRQIEERYVIYVSYIKENPKQDYLSQENKEYMEIQMMKLKNSLPYVHRRQWGLKIDFEQYLRKNIVPQQFFFFLKEKPKQWNEECMKIVPAGLYLCLWCENRYDIDNKLIKRFYETHTKPSYALALEFENSFINYAGCPYEYQSLIF